MSRRHLIWKVVNFLMSRALFVTGQVFAPYSRIGITRVRNTRIFVCPLWLWLRKTLCLQIRYTVPAFSILVATSSQLSQFALPDLLGVREICHIFQCKVLESDRCLVCCFQVVSNCKYFGFLHKNGHAPTTACPIQYIQHVLEFTSCFCIQCQVVKCSPP